MVQDKIEFTSSKLGLGMLLSEAEIVKTVGMVGYTMNDAEVERKDEYEWIIPCSYPNRILLSHRSGQITLEPSSKKLDCLLFIVLNPTGMLLLLRN